MLNLNELIILIPEINEIKVTNCFIYTKKNSNLLQFILQNSQNLPVREIKKAGFPSAPAFSEL